VWKIHWQHNRIVPHVLELLDKCVVLHADTAVVTACAGRDEE
jgi:hypothetical protein